MLHIFFYFRKRTLSINKLLATKSLTGKYIRSLYISGESGSGKSTLCEKLVYDWSHDIDNITNLLSYELVFLIKVGHLQKEDESVTSYIHRVLLGAGTTLYVSDVMAAIRRPDIQDKILFILDGYDELSADGVSLSKLINREYNSQSTILMTTRHGLRSVDNISGHFEATFNLMGFNEKHTLAFIKKYRDITEDDDSPMTRVTDHCLYPIINNPLFLWFISIFGKHSFRPCVDSAFTQTHFLKEVIHEWLKKAEIRLNKPWRECNAALNKLSKIAYRSMCQDEMHFTTNLTKFEVNIGFVSKTTQHSRTDVIYVFNHKLIQEYLAAYFITKKKHNDVCELLCAIPEVSDTNRCQATSVLKFVCGCLRGRDEVLLRVFNVFINKTMLYYKTLPLECLCESGLFNGLKTMTKNFVPQDIVLTTPQSFYYYKALSLLADDSKLSGYHLNRLSINGVLIQDRHVCTTLLRNAQHISLAAQQHFHYYLGVDGVCRRYAIDKLSFNW